MTKLSGVNASNINKLEETKQMTFTKENAKENGAKGGTANGGNRWRKDWRTWGLEKDAQDKFSTPDKYWAWVRENMPALHVQTVMKGVSEEIRSTLEVTDHKVLHIVMPQERLSTSNPAQLDVIAVDGCKVDSTEEEPEDAV